MPATETKLTVKYYFAGEHTTTYSRATGLCVNRDCGHKHRTADAADACKSAPLSWKTYAQLSDGTVTTAVNLWQLGINED